MQCELSYKRRDYKGAKGAGRGSNQNGTTVKKADWVIRLSRITRLSADRKNLTRSVCEVQRGNPV